MPNRWQIMLTVFWAPLTWNDAFYLLLTYLFESADCFFWWSLSCMATRDRSVPKWSTPPPPFSSGLPYFCPDCQLLPANLKISASHLDQAKGKKFFNRQSRSCCWIMSSHLTRLASPINLCPCLLMLSTSHRMWASQRTDARECCQCCLSLSRLNETFWTGGRI